MNRFPGLKRKKAHMVLRDFYELGIWRYKTHLEDVNIIADNRVMRVALRTGTIRPTLGKLLNSLLDEFDFQYGLTVAATEDAFRRVWRATAEFNGGTCVVSYPARLDEFVFRLADGRGGCCKPGAMACRTSRRPVGFFGWLASRHGYETPLRCPLEDVCPHDCKHMMAPFAIQNNTWTEIFTGRGGGGGLRGV
ncbi:MAG: hypothetical protein HY897_10695 [Deltaproteobacteria bacterium]|nr:hypothetical protein [Deltaproteobacteria bacterium]